MPKIPREQAEILYGGEENAVLCLNLWRKCRGFSIEKGNLSFMSKLAEKSLEILHRMRKNCLYA